MPAKYDGETYGEEMPSCDLLSRFSVEIPADATHEQRRCYVNFFIEAFHLIERTGWYEHTSDWDLIVIVEYNDGTRFESSNGATCDWDKPDTLAISDDDTRNFIVNDLDTDSDAEEYPERTTIIDIDRIARIIPAR